MHKMKKHNGGPRPTGESPSWPWHGAQPQMSQCGSDMVLLLFCVTNKIAAQITLFSHLGMASFPPHQAISNTPGLKQHRAMNMAYEPVIWGSGTCLQSTAHGRLKLEQRCCCCRTRQQTCHMTSNASWWPSQRMHNHHHQHDQYARYVFCTMETQHAMTTQLTASAPPH